MKLSSNGVELGRKDWSVAQFAVPAKAAWYDLTLDQQRGPNSWATTSTATHTEWHFLSKPPRPGPCCRWSRSTTSTPTGGSS